MVEENEEIYLLKIQLYLPKHRIKRNEILDLCSFDPKAVETKTSKKYYQ